MRSYNFLCPILHIVSQCPSIVTPMLALAHESILFPFLYQVRLYWFGHLLDRLEVVRNVPAVILEQLSGDVYVLRRVQDLLHILACQSRKRSTYSPVNPPGHSDSSREWPRCTFPCKSATLAIHRRMDAMTYHVLDDTLKQDGLLCLMRVLHRSMPMQ